VIVSSSTPRLRPRLLRLTALAALFPIAIAVLVVAWPRLIVSDQDRLSQRPEASLYYPGSVLISRGGSGATVAGAPAIRRQLGTDSSLDEVLTFYRRELAATGWETGGGSSAATGTDESQACAWHTETSSCA
jgi:hypothetical protein